MKMSGVPNFKYLPYPPETLIALRSETLIHFPLAGGEGDIIVKYANIVSIWQGEDGKSTLRHFPITDNPKHINDIHIAWNPETAQHEINEQVLHALTPWEHRTDPKVVEMSEAAREFIRSMNES